MPAAGSHPATKWDVATLVAIAGLVIALVFNSIQVASTARESKQTRETTQLQLFTTLDGVVNRSLADLRAVGSIPPRGASAKTTSAIEETLDNLDYLAWLFRHGYIDLPGARALWTGKMRCAFEIGRLALADVSAATEFPNLWYVVKRSPPCSA